MHPHAALIRRFYNAFQTRNAAAMRACYTADAVFTDPVFGELRGERIGTMWALLCARAQDLTITTSRVWGDDARGGARWEVRYTFTPTGRRVHNVIDASFTFRDGRIAAHHDRFGLWRWARQALGPAGLLLGWTPLVRGRIRAQARRGLDAWIAAGGR